MEADISEFGQSDRGLLYAEACFETVRVVKGAVFRWSRHEARLREGLSRFGLACPEGLLDACLNAAAGQGDDALVRLTVSGGEAARGLLPRDARRPKVSVQAWPYRQPVQRLDLRSLHWPFGGMARCAKFTADYAMTIRLLYDARRKAEIVDGETALFTGNGEILAAETANILLHVDGRWRTPESEAVLPGVVRGALIEAGAVEAVRCPTRWLQACDAAAICNSGCFVRAASSINGRALRKEKEIYRRLLAPLQGMPGVPEGLCV